ncbi:hypothetical protein TcWFU_010488 [Taenia crassiceps]|uniref:Uncharacterized protein n=1 Tax=Taenia crassiceps TaxID=6207 RepID=A0ABR4QTD9_9CEST
MDVNTDVVNQLTSTCHFKEFFIYDYPGSPVYHDLFDNVSLVDSKSKGSSQGYQCSSVTEIEAKRFAEEAGIKYCELSIKEARNVLEPFNILARDFYELYQSTADRFREML